MPQVRTTYNTSPRPMYAERPTAQDSDQGGGVMRAKMIRILISGASLASLLMAAGAKWKV
jgi:hypothetical protein